MHRAVPDGGLSTGHTASGRADPNDNRNGWYRMAVAARLDGGGADQLCAALTGVCFTYPLFDQPDLFALALNGNCGYGRSKTLSRCWKAIRHTLLGFQS